VLRHPLHPALVHFPLALLLTATLADVAMLAGVWSDRHFALVLMGLGLVAGLAAMAAGLADFTRLDETLAPPAIRHMATICAAWIGYAVALYLRRDLEAPVPAASTVLSLASGAVLAVGGFLGGDLVYRYGAGRIRD
jgi:uncharacterized membrane protein